MSKYDTDGLPTEFFAPGEMEVFLDLIAKHRPRVVVEFGVNRGRNAAAVLRNFDFVEKYVGIDVLPGYLTGMKCQRNEVPLNAGELASHDPRFHLRLSKNGSYDLADGDLPACDFVFIDGDHSRAGVLNDHAIAMSHIRCGGVILFHDDNGRPEVQVTETLAELRKAGYKITHIDGTWFALQEVL
jgi:predicted O-methyltransferase YrrM